MNEYSECIVDYRKVFVWIIGFSSFFIVYVLLNDLFFVLEVEKN